MKHILIADVFTREEIDRALALWRAVSEPVFRERARAEIVEPMMPRLKEQTEQDNDPRYLTYLLEFLVTQNG